MKKNENLYKVAVQRQTENATLIVSTYELSESSNSYFMELKLGPHTIKHPNISIPSDRQANEMEELFIIGNTTFIVNDNRLNEEQKIKDKIVEIFGTDVSTNMAKI
ncbi:MAG: hypothetical protein K9G58_01290 [Bacteroidales bacterium]|nr:hypothetical protein [Bacteroidales bacterium]